MEPLPPLNLVGRIWWAIGFGLVFGLLGVWRSAEAWLLSGGPGWMTLSFSAFTGAMGVYLIAAGLFGVRLSADTSGVRIRQFWRDEFVPWSSVETVESGGMWAPTPEPADSVLPPRLRSPASGVRTPVIRLRLVHIKGRANREVVVWHHFAGSAAKLVDQLEARRIASRLQN